MKHSSSNSDRRGIIVIALERGSILNQLASPEGQSYPAVSPSAYVVRQEIVPCAGYDRSTEETGVRDRASVIRNAFDRLA